MQNLSPLLTAHYLGKAVHFLGAMKLLADDLATYKSSVGLLAVHSAISLNDAILAGVTGKRSKGEDHGNAARELEKVCALARIKNTNGIQHLTWLLGKKTEIAYGEHRLSDATLQLSIDKAERFSNWAYTNFKEVLRVEPEP
jgi:hypothetical protein